MNTNNTTYIIALLALISFVHGIQIVDLNGTWKLSNANKSVSCDATVPGQVHTDLMAVGIIGDPLFRDNDAKYRWIAFDDWIYSREFEVSADFLVLPAILLKCEGLDTITKITINGNIVAETRSQFMEHVVDIKDNLKQGQNLIEITFSSAATYAAEQASHYPYPAPESPQWMEKAVPNRQFIRKKGSDFGWDWGPAFVTCGIHLPISIIGYKARFSWTSVNVRPGFVVDVSCEIVSTADLPVNLAIDIDGLHQGSQTIQLRAGTNEFTTSINISPSDVELWWPNGYGGQKSYDVHINLDDHDEAHKRIGFRQIELVQDAVGDGRTLYFRVNNRAIFAKGTNLIPFDVFESRVTDDKIVDVINAAKNGNLNMIRVWGGGLYQKDAFYDMCDAAGLLVWQEFMFACAVFPADDEFLALVESEVEYQVHRLMHHASIALWSGSNENQVAFTWFHDTRKYPHRYAIDFDKLYNGVVRETLTKIDKVRSFWISSPSNGYLSTNPLTMIWEDAKSPHYGDTHHYDYIIKCTDPGVFPKTRFASEYGWQSLPYNFVEATVPEDWSWDSYMMIWRQHHVFGDAELRVQVARHFRLPDLANSSDSFNAYIYLTQCMQALCMEAETSHYRRGRYNEEQTMGAMGWMLNDVWQAPTWSSIEYGSTRWKLTHYAVKRVMSDLSVSLHVSGLLELSGFVLSDMAIPSVNGSFNLIVREWKDAKIVYSQLINFDLPNEGGKEVFRKNIVAMFVEAGSLPEHCIVTASVTAQFDGVTKTAETFWLPVDLALADLPHANISITVTGMKDNTVTIDVDTDAMAVFVELSADIGGHFSDNGFVLVPGTPKSLVFYGKESSRDVKFIARSIRNTYK